MNSRFSTPLDIKLMNASAWALYALFAIAALGIVAAWAMQTSIFAIKKITVIGEVRHTSMTTLRAYVTPRLRGGFLTMDLAQAREIFESVPWVRRAVVQREFPNRLTVQLQEHQTVAFWGADGESRLLNDHGEVFEANTGELEHYELPRLIGPQGQGAKVLQSYRSLEPLFADTDLILDRLELTARGSWLARLNTGAVLHLGRGTPAEVVARTQRFVSTLTQVTSKYGRKLEALESADLRHESGYAIRIRGVTTIETLQKKK